MSDLPEACADLAEWLPHAQALTAVPDTQPAPAHSQHAVSAPPWNAPAATVVLDAVEGARRIESAFREQVTGRPSGPRPASGTGRTIHAITQLAFALPPCPPPEFDQNGKRKLCPCGYCQAVRDVNGWVTRVLELPPVDLVQRPRRLRAPCPYCGARMLMWRPGDGRGPGRVTCLRVGVCRDANGDHPEGKVERGKASNLVAVWWNDGLVQHPVDAETETG
jgi:hypothetical protein